MEEKIVMMMPDTMRDTPPPQRRVRLMIGQHEIPGVVSISTGEKYGAKETVLIQVLTECIELPPNVK